MAPVHPGSLAGKANRVDAGAESDGDRRQPQALHAVESTQLGGIKVVCGGLAHDPLLMKKGQRELVSRSTQSWNWRL